MYVVGLIVELVEEEGMMLVNMMDLLVGGVVIMI